VEGVKVERHSDASVSVLDTISNFFGELLRFERPMAAMAAAALIVLLVVGLQTSEDGAGKIVKTERSPVATNQDSTPSTEAIAKKSNTPTTVTSDKATPVMAKKKNRRERVLEEQADQRDMAAIESKRAPAGVRIDIDQDQGRPAIVWHVDEDVEDAPN
jgi:FtsZ-interacting cell division protein ZipA